MGYANPHAATSIGGATLTYDNNGNVAAIGSLDYTWDWRNRLASAERTGGGSTTYGYDHTGQRMFKATGTATTSYPSRYFNLATTTGSATTTKHIFSPGGELLATVVGASTTASTTYLHLDHLGGTNVTTDEDGEVTQTLDYYPYGSQRIASGSFNEQRRFIGEEYDPDTAFSYLNARYYESSRGQFMSQDPVFLNWGIDKRTSTILGDPQLQNSYTYSRGNPLVLQDKGGEFVANVVLGAGAGLVGQYAYDVYNNIQTGGFSASALYSNLSSPETYLTRAGQGAIVAGTGGLAGNVFGLGLVGQSAGVGGASGLTSLGSSRILEGSFNYQGAVTDAIFGAATFGLVGNATRVPGRLPNFGTKAFFAGKHTQQSAFRLGVDSTSTYLSSLIGNTSLSRTLGGPGSNPPSSAGSYSSFGLKADTQITRDNVGSFISFISQFLQ
jgi:RHS repeat-associated protein